MWQELTRNRGAEGPSSRTPQTAWRIPTISFGPMGVTHGADVCPGSGGRGAGGPTAAPLLHPFGSLGPHNVGMGRQGGWGLSPPSPGLDRIWKFKPHPFFPPPSLPPFFSLSIFQKLKKPILNAKAAYFSSFFFLQCHFLGSKHCSWTPLPWVFFSPLMPQTFFHRIPPNSVWMGFCFSFPPFNHPTV